MIFCTEEQLRADPTMPPSSNKPSLPSNLTFAVQLSAEAQVAHGEFTGRIEHVVSMRATHFQSLNDIAAFIVQVLTTLQEDDDDL